MEGQKGQEIWVREKEMITSIKERGRKERREIWTGGKMNSWEAEEEVRVDH